MTDAPALLRAHAEQDNAAELEALGQQDDRQRPLGWRLSPWAVVSYILGGKLADGTPIVPKYIGDRRLVASTPRPAHLAMIAYEAPG